MTPSPAAVSPTRSRRSCASSVAVRPRTRLLFIRRPDRRHHDGVATYVADSRRGATSDLPASKCEEHEELRRPRPVRSRRAARRAALPRLHARKARPLLREVRATALRGDSANSSTSRPRWQCTHVGGDRFAGQPRLPPARHLLRSGRPRRRAGRSSTTTSRGGSRSTTTAAARAGRSPSRRRSGAFVREEGLTGLDDLSLAGVSTRRGSPLDGRVRDPGRAARGRRRRGDRRAHAPHV